MSRTATLTGKLARSGFGDPDAAAQALAEWPGESSVLIAELADSADPDLALGFLMRLPKRAELAERLATDPDFRRRLVRLLGGSSALGQQLLVHPEWLEIVAGELSRRPVTVLVAELLAAIEARNGVADATRSDDLRLAYQRELLRIAARDLAAPDPLAEVESVAGELADLADATLTAALALARGEVAGHERVRFAIIALGKCGAQELNYVSDVDVLFVAEPVGSATSAEAVQIGTKLAAAVTRICSAHTACGTIWPVDAALRPEGKAGALVRTLDGMRDYYSKWAKNWEFQAMLKARPAAGDAGLGQAFVELVAPLVWRASEQPHFVADAQAMRKRVVDLIPAREQGREIKLGSGGLRDVEFTVQLLQLVHGRTDESLRVRGTFSGLSALIAGGYVGRVDGATLADEYRFQRLLEHRVQLAALRRSHLVPSDEAGLRRLSRALGVAEVESAWRRSAQTVLTLHQRLFYSPLLAAVARIPSDEARLSPAAAQTWLSALGFADPVAALTHIKALSQGVSRAAAIQRQLLPAMLGWFADGPNPDHGLMAFRQVSEAMGSTSWYLRTLRDGGATAQNFATVLSSSRYVVSLLMRAPQAVSMLADDGGLAPRSLDEIASEMASMTKRHADAEVAISVVRAVRRYELLRLAMADLLGRIDLTELGQALSAVTSATISAALTIAAREAGVSPRIGVVALGRLGGGEMSYSSDADAIFILADTDDPQELKAATAVIARTRALLAAPGPDPSLVIDADLRPEGKSGPLVRTMTATRAYYEQWHATWEAQALLRAGFGAGDEELVAEFLTAIQDLRYPASGLDERQVGEIRRLKARMEVERLPRGGDPKRQLKLGPGGLSDVEWTVQLLQLRYAGRVPSLRRTQTLPALTAAVAAELLPRASAEELAAAWTMASRVRNAVLLLRGRPVDQLPTDPGELSALAAILGYGKGEASVLVDDYQRVTRRARIVMEQVFWEER